MSKAIAAITPSRTMGLVTGTNTLPTPAVKPAADTAAVGELAAVGLVHTAEPTVALDAIDDAPVIGSRIGEVLIPDSHHPAETVTAIYTGADHGSGHYYGLATGRFVC